MASCLQYAEDILCSRWKTTLVD